MNAAFGFLLTASGVLLSIFGVGLLVSGLGPRQGDGFGNLGQIIFGSGSLLSGVLFLFVGVLLLKSSDPHPSNQELEDHKEI